MPGVYLSFPFCAQKCTYCNFASGVFPRELEERYLEALLWEIRSHQWHWKPETVYIGGGTPSRLGGDAWKRVLDAIPGREWVEATLEAAPGDVTEEKAAGWASAGIRRVSFGVQSFEPRELAQTGRKHSAEIVEREVALLRAVGIENINLDLIAGLPHQTVESFSRSLDWIERLGVPHVSVYMLEVDEDSRLGQELIVLGSRYGAASVPDDDAIVAMYAMAIERLARMGVPRYEISNFARPGFESAHNLKYWRMEPYVGFGADAHSFTGGERIQNAETAADYVARRERGEPVTVDRVESTPGERLMVGLRLAAGVLMTGDDWQRYGAVVERFEGSGLMERKGDILRLTDRGVLYSNDVLQEFLDD